MKIKMIDLAAGPDGIMQSGAEYEVKSDFAQALIAGHHAVAVTKIMPLNNRRKTGDGSKDTSSAAAKKAEDGVTEDDANDTDTSKKCSTN